MKPDIMHVSSPVPPVPPVTSQSTSNTNTVTPSPALKRAYGMQPGPQHPQVAKVCQIS